MKKRIRTAMIICLIALVPAFVAFAAGKYYAVDTTSNVPKIIPYDGTLEKDGLPAKDASYNMLFEFYDNGSAGTKLWDEAETVATKNGKFSVNLGSTKALGVDVFDTSELWLQITVEGNVLLPRQKINSVPYAIKAAGADSANKVEINVGGKRYSTNAVFRGTSKGVTGGSFTDGGSQGAFSYSGLIGYEAAKKVCEVALGSQTAHMCSSSEVVISKQTGIFDLPQLLWVSTAESSILYQPAPAITIYARDCEGWTIDVYTDCLGTGTACAATGCSKDLCELPACSSTKLIACCDF